VLELDGLVRTFGDVRALDGLTFSVPPGKMFGFLGPNGAGKTTAMRAVFGLTFLQAGEVRWNGAAVTRSVTSRFGYLPEERGLYPTMVVRDQLVYLGRIRGLGARASAGATDMWLERLGLADRASSKVQELSLGNQQRVQLAGSLLHEPEVVVLDEPFSGLDPFAMDSMSALLAEIARNGAAVLFSSHQLDVVEHLCEDVVVIDSGHVVLAGPLGTIRDAAPDRYVEVTVERDPERLLHVPRAEVVAHDGNRVRLRVPRTTEPLGLLAGLSGDIMRFTYEPPTLSELFRAAVAGERAVTVPEVRVAAS
jgi:ABC-2 type transport system ATP-binding protein